jgi:ligand-binding SRPBCC domain-containing protein
MVSITDEVSIGRGAQRGERVLRTRVRVPVPRRRVFEFFADPANLERITPPELRFSIVTSPGALEAGSLIEYRLRLFRIRFGWLTRIAVWDPPLEFADEQIEGPYASWYHRHSFHADGAGTVVEDEVRFRLPIQPLGELAAPIVAAQLRRIFRYRRQALLRALDG